MIKRKKISASRLPYTKVTEGKFRDLRQVEVNVRKRFARISLNGIHRKGKFSIDCARHGNPGWALGFENFFVNWTHYRRHCWHLSLEARGRGITLSYGRHVV